ncbi:MAG: histidine kinase [Lachnospiraceae bacterium]|nr:histidine kinase [Lachnospiraceae bacterium]
MNRLKEIFRNQKLNRKFTFVIVLFTIIPIGIFGSVLFYSMEKNVVDENLNYMAYTMQRNQDAITSKIDSMNMSTQFFLSDEGLFEILNKAAAGKEISIHDWVEFKDYNVSSLERLVYNNPLLYAVRVYAANDNVQEMMPVLYQNSRMKKQLWAENVGYFGWNYNYKDQAFSNHTMSQNSKMIGLITPVKDENDNTIGIIEAAMTMENMFPSLYEDIENEWSFFYSDKGDYYFDEEKSEPDTLVLHEIVSRIPKEETIQTIYREMENQNFVISYMPVSELDGTLISVKNITGNVQEVHSTRNIFILGMVVLMLILAVFTNQIVHGLLRQFYDILSSIRKVQNGDLDVIIENCGKDEMGELGTQINEMLQRIKALMDDNLKREMLAKNSEIRALQNQINAHFIYNVLESIKMMAEINEEYDISDAVTALGKLLRYSMKWVSGNVLVEQELEYIKNYMALINLRYDYEIYLSLNIPELILKQEIPKMSLQPIIENAICHGIEEIAEDTNIYMKGLFDGEDCIIEITDTGKGMSEEDVEKLRLKIAGELDSNGGSGNGIGLKNVQDRIHIAFGNAYGIEIASKLGCYTKIMVRIPMSHPGDIEEKDMRNVKREHSEIR